MLSRWGKYSGPESGREFVLALTLPILSRTAVKSRKRLGMISSEVRAGGAKPQPTGQIQHLENAFLLVCGAYRSVLPCFFIPADLVSKS